MLANSQRTAADTMIDPFGRAVSYLRVSVTDRCDFRCVYCMSEDMNFLPRADLLTLEELDRLCSAFIARGVRKLRLTGGEPLAQKSCLALLRALCDRDYSVSLETSGAIDVAAVDSRVSKILDIKTPASGEVDKNRWENLAHMTPRDEIKFVIGSVQDYEWAKEQVLKRGLAAVCPLLFSWVTPLQPHQQDKVLKPVPAGQTPIARLDLVERIIADALPVRFQLQMHKIVWAPDQRGV